MSYPVFQRCTIYCFPHGFISSEYIFPCVRGTQFSNFFRVSFTTELTFLSVRGAWFTRFFRVSFICEFTFLSVRGGWFTGFFRVSFTTEVTFTRVRGALFTTFLRVSSPVSALSHVSEVHDLVISLGFHSPVSCFMFQRCTVYPFHQGFLQQ